MSRMYSIVVVSLNAGAGLLDTLKSIERQTCTDYEVIVKDGGSEDSSVEDMKRYLEEHQEFSGRVRFYSRPDRSIYDAMNQAVEYAEGRYYYFLNCGDLLKSDLVLEQIGKAIEERNMPEAAIFYGDIYDALRNKRIASNPKLDAFACYRNVPCHQACFYSGDLFSRRKYNPEYRVRADYEHFLWCFFKARARMIYEPVTVASYEGGGYSETGENRKRSEKERREITAKYMTKGQRIRYQLLLWITLAPLRTKMAESRRFSGFYQKIKSVLYSRR